jgi:hypothetical protein
LSPPHPPQAFRLDAPWHVVASLPLQAHLPSPHDPHDPPGGLASELQPSHLFAADAPVHMRASLPMHSYLPPQPQAPPTASASLVHPPQALTVSPSQGDVSLAFPSELASAATALPASPPLAPM